MFFYTSLFVACVVAALLVVYLYNALVNAGRVFYRSFLPSSKDKIAGHLSRTRYYSTRNDTPAPWGWRGNNGEVREHGSHASSTSGLDAFISDHGKRSATAGWPNREEKKEFVGSAYKVSRKAGSANSRRGPRGKPWGW